MGERLKRFAQEIKSSKPQPRSGEPRASAARGAPPLNVHTKLCVLSYSIAVVNRTVKRRQRRAPMLFKSIVPARSCKFANISGCETSTFQ